MRIVRYEWQDGIGYGLLNDEEQIQPLVGSPFADLANASSASGAAGARQREHVPILLSDGAAVPLDAVRLLAPCEPGKIIGIGRNYAAHAAEHHADVPKEPLMFLKPPSAVIGPGDAIRLTALSNQVEHEGELVVVIGKPCRNIEAVEAADYIFGYTCGNDVTARDLQRRDGQWSRAKGFDTFCPLGPWIETELDTSRLDVTCHVNGTLRQQGSTADLVFAIPHLIAYASQVMTLQPGDVIMTGTPAGVGPLAEGDEVSVEISGLGTLRNRVTSQ